jgi:hypothetical protein
MDSYLLCKCPDCGKESILLDVDYHDAPWLERPFETHIHQNFQTTCAYCGKAFAGVVADCRVVKATQVERIPNK